MIFTRLQALLKGEKIVVCRGAPDGGNKRRLQTLLSVTSLLDPIEKDFGKIVDISKEDSADLVLVAYVFYNSLIVY